ncbi:hypothetical protein LCGC14_1509620 [marine sediment metagenome]|uniref:Uncharacterized protein n=1 Tax=marine sediment metagenome TaxID=412755 RepID=A0A0F9M2Y7_9ZZZZ
MSAETPGDRGWRQANEDQRFVDEWRRSDGVAVYLTEHTPGGCWQIGIPYVGVGDGWMHVSTSPDGFFGYTAEVAMQNADELWPLGFFNTGQRCTCPVRVGNANSDVNTVWCQKCKLLI